MKIKSSVLEQELVFALSPLRRMKGLLFCPWFKGVLMLAPCKSVHTWGMKRPIDLAFLDRSGKVIAVYCGVLPCRLRWQRGSYVVLERFASANLPWFQVGDCVVLTGKKGARL